jgi:hypothetical protein
MTSARLRSKAKKSQARDYEIEINSGDMVTIIVDGGKARLVFDTPSESGPLSVDIDYEYWACCVTRNGEMDETR